MGSCTQTLEKFKASENNKMGYPSTLLSLLVLSISVSNIYATVAIAVPAITIPAVAISADLATTAAALGLVKLKTAAILAATRSRRSTIVENHVFEKVAELEQEKCVRRFLCEVASGQLQAPEYLQSVESMKAENLEALVGSAELPYTESVKYGAKTKSVAKCQNKYVCEKTGKEILLVLGLYGA